MQHWTIKALAACALVTALAVGTPPGVTPATAKVKCGYAPNCTNLRGQDRSDCEADRAEAEADCQLHDTRRTGDAVNDPGPGQKYHDCKDKAEKLRGASPNGPTSYDKDC